MNRSTSKSICSMFRYIILIKIQQIVSQVFQATRNQNQFVTRVYPRDQFHLVFSHIVEQRVRQSPLSTTG